MSMVPNLAAKFLSSSLLLVNAIFVMSHLRSRKYTNTLEFIKIVFTIIRIELIIDVLLLDRRRIQF
jgi:hypothetical protein